MVISFSLSLTFRYMYLFIYLYMCKANLSILWLNEEDEEKKSVGGVNFIMILLRFFYRDLLGGLCLLDNVYKNKWKTFSAALKWIKW